MSTYVISSKLLNQTRELTPTEKVLVVAIQSLSKERGYCYATNTYLADSLGKDKTTISKSLTSLEDKGFINRFIVRDERKMVVERKVSLTKKFLSKFVEELVNTANNISESTKQKTTKAIRVSKKAIDKAKISLNKIKKQQNKQEESNQDQQPETPVNPFEVGIPDEQKLEDKPCLDFINHDLFVQRYGNPSEEIIALEKAYSIYEFNTVLAGSLNTDVINVEAYFADSLKKNRNKLNQGMHNIKSGANVKRKEKTDCGHFTRDEKGNLVGNYSYEPQNNNSTNESFDSNRINKMNETASKLGLPTFIIGTVGGIR